MTNDLYYILCSIPNNGMMVPTQLCFDGRSSTSSGKAEPVSSILQHQQLSILRFFNFQRPNCSTRPNQHMVQSAPKPARSFPIPMTLTSR